MTKVVVDTSVLIDFVNGYASWLPGVLKSPEEFTAVVPTVVIAEYFASQEFEDKRKIRVADKTLSYFIKQDLTEEIAKILGTLWRRKAYPPGANTGDLIIASTAIYLSAELATRNRRHFEGIPDLRFFDPRKLDF